MLTGRTEASAPGRVNLIGEHTDYNDGWVLPVALEEGVTVALELADGVEVHSADGDARPYAAAIAEVAGTGFRATVTSTLAVGAGLASSAALEVALLRALRAAGAVRGDDAELARLAHVAETEHVGVPCGVMDQLACALGRPGEPLLIDCRTREVTPLPWPAGLELRVLQSGVRHANATSGYAERRAECARAAELLGVRALRDATDWRSLPAPLDRRARHVIEENARVLAAADALRAGDAAALAALMRASHASQRDLFEVSVPEVDAVVERAEREGALAARLTGGGFGGAVVAIASTG